MIASLELQLAVMAHINHFSATLVLSVPLTHAYAAKGSRFQEMSKSEGVRLSSKYQTGRLIYNLTVNNTSSHIPSIICRRIQ